jgi:hypothetical protein
MSSSTPPIDLPDDLRRGLEMAAAEAGKSPTEIIIRALENLGIERLTEDQQLKRMTGAQ